MTLNSKLGLAIGTVGLIAYGIAGCFSPEIKKAKQELEPIWDRFQQVTENGPVQTRVVNNFDEYLVLDYGGRLKEVLAERDRFLSKYHPTLIKFRGWYAEENEWGKPKAADRLDLFDYWPF